MQANGAAMWRFGTTFGIKSRAGTWSLTSALPTTGLGQTTLSSHVQQNGHLTHPQRKINACGRQHADNQNISFSPRYECYHEHVLRESSKCCNTDSVTTPYFNQRDLDGLNPSGVVFFVEDKEEEEEEEDLFVFNDTIEGPGAPAVKPGRITDSWSIRGCTHSQVTWGVLGVNQSARIPHSDRVGTPNRARHHGLKPRLIIGVPAL